MILVMCAPGPILASIMNEIHLHIRYQFFVLSIFLLLAKNAFCDQ